VEEVEVVVVGAGCEICHAALCDCWSVVKEHRPFLLDERLLLMVLAGEWGTVREVMNAAAERWRRADEAYRSMNADAKGPVVPYMITSEGEYIAKEVYDRLEELRGGE
jgi:hypothetical protein